MKICHVSDTHSLFPKLNEDYDVIVHSGDMLPNRKPRLKIDEHLFQRDWIREHAAEFKTWIGEKLFLFCAGNHDYTEPCTELRDIGINAFDITNKQVEIEGIKFYGFPYVPYIGYWNWEAPNRMMEEKVKELIEIVNKNKIDVLVAHCPPYGILDQNREGTHIGNTHMTAALMEFDPLPKAFLCGHCHERPNEINLPINGKHIKIVNSATTQRIIEV